MLQLGKHVLIPVVATALLSVALSSHADPLDDAYAADGARDYKTAYSLFRPLAEGGNAKAQLRIGAMYSSGEGVKQNLVEALKWFRKAADQGNIDAQYNLGKLYYDGEGTKQNYAESVKWYRKAAEQGDADAQFRVGAAYFNGTGVKQDSAEAAKWISKSAELGYAEAEYHLSRLYVTGNGVEQNPAEAMKWLRMSAEHGYAAAQHVLGDVYASGELGVKKDLTEAARWYRKAAGQGDAKAKVSLARVEAKTQKSPWVGKKTTERLLDLSTDLKTTIVLNGEAKMELPPDLDGPLKKHNNSKIDFLLIVNQSEVNTVAAELPLTCRVQPFKKFMGWATNASHDKEVGFMFKLFVIEEKILKEKYNYTPKKTLFCKHDEDFDKWGKYFSFPREGFNFIAHTNPKTNMRYAYHVDKFGMLAIYF